MLNRKKRINKTATLFLSTFFYLIFSTLSFVYAETKSVRVTPIKVVFEGRQRTSNLRLINTNDKKCSFRISLVSMKMDINGNRIKVKSPTPEDIAVQKMIRFSPRRTTLLPGKWQTIRLMIRKPRDLADGEYMTYINFTPEPDAETSQKKESPTGIGINIDYVIAISLPIIIRQGKDNSVGITPHKPVLKTSKKGDYFLEIELSRTGEYSFYGNVIVYHTDENGTGQKQIEILKGISIFAANKKQIIKIPISKEDKKLLATGKIKVDIVNMEIKGKPIINSKSFNL